MRQLSCYRQFTAISHQCYRQTYIQLNKESYSCTSITTSMALWVTPNNDFVRQGFYDY